MNKEITKIFTKNNMSIQQKYNKIKEKAEQTSKTSTVQLAEIRIEGIAGCGALYPGRIARVGGEGG